MNGPDPTPAVAEALQRLADALDDMSEELPGQLALAKNPATTVTQKAELLAVLEKQLCWLAGDMARTRLSLPAVEKKP